jgi:hypothetical protein
MKAGNESKVSFHLMACAAALALGAMACNGAISTPGGTPGGGPGSGSGSAASGVVPSGTGGAIQMNQPTGAGGAGGAPSTGPLDSGRLDIDRLNNLEYDNTIMALLGVDGMAQATFQPDEEGEFDNDSDAFTLNDARFEQYFNAADTIGETVFADTTPTGLRQTYVYGLVSPPCTPSTTDTTCSSQIIAAFGAKAWRRPLTPDEVTGLQALATNAIMLGENADGAIKQVVKTMIASPQFLYRIEYDPNPTSTVAHAISPYEMASRLSYTIWSNMPDSTLFNLAATGNNILTNAYLTMQVDRMLADPKGANFTNSFAGQWLGARDMQAHQVEPTAFPSFDEPLRAAFVTEELMYFDQFLTGTLPMTQFFTNTNNFVNTRLATHYGFGTPTGTTYQMVTGGSPNRIGFMGLGSFLTFTSYSYRTAPTLRGKWILLNLLCQTIPSPPPGVPSLDGTAQATDASVQQEDVRARLTAHRAMATCAACHALLDPIGLGLENFDAIGHYRTSYTVGGPTIDSSGMLPTGETFSSLPQLAGILSMGTHGQELTACASHKMMTYALARELNDPGSDTPYLQQVQMQWSTQGYGLKDLMKDIVTNDTFKFRRGESM